MKSPEEASALHLILHHMGFYRRRVAWSMTIKLSSALTELLIPYILEYLIDEIVPRGRLSLVLFWSALMIVTAILTRQLNVWANRIAVDNAHRVSYDIRQAFFTKTLNLSGAQFDRFGLPSLISRLTSDSYNVQSAVQASQTMCVRMPMMLVGGIVMTLLMDPPLATILLVIVPVLVAVILAVSRYGIPLYRQVQARLDEVVQVMREDITGIRVVKALSKTGYETRRFAARSDAMTRADIKASTVMAIPGPLMQMCLNLGLTLVVWFGARRVYSGQIQSGVILAFLTYFNMVIQGVMGINRIFIMLSKATASANRIAQVLAVEPDQPVLALKEAKTPQGEEFIRFEHVSFSYDAAAESHAQREECLHDISFALKRGESLGIIGPTGCGKTTIVNLLMRFYDVTDGGVFVDGRDVRTYELDALRQKFGVVFQNDTVFYNTLRENIRFGRPLEDLTLLAAVEDAAASDYLGSLADGLDHQAEIKGANLSGGQKQRLLIARALAGDPEILVLDDSSSALDYRTDAALRRAIHEHHSHSTTIMIAQRVSSIQSMTHILVMDNGRCIGYGDHKTLLETCPAYQDIYRAQMGALA